MLPLSPELPLPTPQAKGVEGLAARKGFVIVAGDSEAGDISICQVLVTTQCRSPMCHLELKGNH